tara:strand:- start:478 stop:2538 length:2061 start_codon:yes stop_codon:yes gene_type:complete
MSVDKFVLSASGGTEETDDDFNLVTGLYKFDGSNSANNNTFLDSSSNNFTVTRRGNASQGTFSPFSADEGKWAVRFPNSEPSDQIYVTPASTADFSLGTGAFTIETWVFITADNYTYSRVFNIGPFWNSANTVALVVNDTAFSDKISFAAYAAGGNNRTCISQNATPMNQWVHIAVSRDTTGDFRLFINGNLDATNTSYRTTDLSSLGTATMAIGNGLNRAVEEPFEGFISNFRLVKGTALYTSSFTPSTSPLTVVTNTKLLTCCSNRFVDKSVGATFSFTGSPKIQPFSPFAPSTSYRPTTKGGSMSSNDSGDGATIAANTALDLLSNGTFTIDFWFYRTSSFGTYSDYVGIFNGVSSGVLLYQSGSNFQVYINGSTIFNVTHPANFQWVHVALTRDGTTLRLFFNGVLQGSSTASLGASNFPLSIAADNTGRVGMQGFMSDVRAIKGTALYTSAFTPPTSPSTAVTNTSALFSFTNAAMFDQSGKATMVNYGNVALNTSVKKFGTASVYFDGGATQKIEMRDIIPFGTGPFTVEFFMKTNTSSLATAYRRVFKTGLTSVASNIMELFINSGNGTGYGTTTNLSIYTGATSLIGTTAVADNNWHHVAVTRDTSSNLRMFIDGNQSGSTTASYTNDLNLDDFLLGRYRSNGLQGGEYLGYLDELRITLKARYTSNFTAPSKTFPNL